MSDAVSVMREVLRQRESHNDQCACPICGEGMTRLVSQLEMNELPASNSFIGDPPPKIPPGMEEMLRKLCEPAAPGIKHDSEKDPWNLLPWNAVGSVVKVLAHGALKYSPDNWRKVEPYRERYFAAAMRHLVAWWLGEKLDPESGLPHISHAICCLLFIAAREGA